MLGKYTSYYTIPFIGVGIICIFAVGFFIVPDSPAFLLSQNRVEEAERAYLYFNGVKKDSENSQTLLTEMQNLLKVQSMNSEEDTKLTSKDFCKH